MKPHATTSRGRPWTRLLAVALPALFLGVPRAHATNAWANYHWGRTANPFTLQIENDLTTSEWQAFLGAVATDWTASTVLDTTIVNTRIGKRSCPTISGKIVACNAKYGFNGWLGLAQIWLSGGHIVQGVVKVNDSYFSTSTYNNPSAKRHVMCQEVGHTLGLDHQRAPDSRSCMDDVNGLFDAAFVSPNAHDYEELVIIYGSHTDASSTVSTATAPQGAVGGNGPDFGAPGSGRAPETLFVQDLGGGRHLLTWVYWAEPGAAGLE